MTVNLSVRHKSTIREAVVHEWVNRHQNSCCQQLKLSLKFYSDREDIVASPKTYHVLSHLLLWTLATTRLHRSATRNLWRKLLRTTCTLISVRSEFQACSTWRCWRTRGEMIYINEHISHVDNRTVSLKTCARITEYFWTSACVPNRKSIRDPEIM